MGGTSGLRSEVSSDLVCALAQGIDELGLRVPYVVGEASERERSAQRAVAVQQRNTQGSDAEGDVLVRDAVPAGPRGLDVFGHLRSGGEGVRRENREGRVPQVVLEPVGAEGESHPSRRARV